MPKQRKTSDEDILFKSPNTENKNKTEEDISILQ